MSKSVDAVDRWTFVHFGTGFLMARFMSTSPDKVMLAVTTVAVVWEIWEKSENGVLFWNQNGYPDYRGDSVENAVSDVLATVTGGYVAINFFCKLSNR